MKQVINKVGETLDHVICEINNETSMIDEIIYKASVMDNDTLHLIDDKLDKIITQARKILKISPENKAEDKTKNKTEDKTKNKVEDNNIPKSKAEGNNIPKNKAEDNNIHKTKAEDKTMPKNNAEDKDNNIPKAKYMYEDIKENRYIPTFIYVSKPLWSNHVTELCETWIHKNNEYAYTGYEKIYKYAGEVLSTREHNAMASKHKQNFINIDELKVFKGITKYNILKVHNDSCGNK